MISRALLRLLLGSLFVFSGICGRARSTTEARDSSLVKLPNFEITAHRALPPPEAWRYAEIPGFEILSSGSDRETQRLLREFRLFNQALGVVWPALLGGNPNPVSIVLCGRRGEFARFTPANFSSEGEQGFASLFLRNQERSVIVVDLQTRELALSALAGFSSVGGVENSGYIEVDSDTQLFREYVHSLLARANPRLPAWLEEGLAQLLTGMKFSENSIEFARLDDPDTVSVSYANTAAAGAAAAEAGDTTGLVVTASGEDRAFNAALARTSLMPLGDLFAVSRDSSIARNPIGSKWAKQSSAFIHMCLYQRRSPYQQGFVKFVMRATREPVTEALFEECFGVNFKQMQLELRGYINFTSYKALTWNAPRGQGFATPAPLALRDATDAEVGRIKGEALSLAEAPEAARTELIAPYLRGERDPQLLGALGLHEMALPHTERAQRFLEAATVGGVKRPLVYVELARLKYRAALARGATPGAEFSATERDALVQLLLTARNLPPVLPEVYEVLSDVLALCSSPPAEETMQVLYEGVARFPGRLGLIYQTAVLCQRRGDLERANSLVEHGLQYAPTGEPQERFAALKANLGASGGSMAPPPTKSE
ncbi:MAG: hypothetical protein Q8M02_15525 [Candidatus Didemnitutus sp.]|nr:hypothetical protein [Candidatus Didemnitutus sp.]